MPPTTYRPSAAATADVYEDVADVLDRTARRFARRYNQDYEEAAAEARLYFLKEYVAGKLSGGGAKAKTAFRVYRRLQSRVRLDAQRSAKLRRQSLEAVPGRCDPPVFDLDAILGFVSKDSVTVLTLLFSDERFAELLRAERHPGPTSVRRTLVRRLREMGWDTDRVEESFEEILWEMVKS